MSETARPVGAGRHCYFWTNVWFTQMNFQFLARQGETMKSYSSIIDTSIDTSEKARIDSSEETPERRSARLWPLLLHEIFEAQADARPENVAVVFGRE